MHFCNFVKSLGLPLVISSRLWITDTSKHLYQTVETAAQLAIADQITTNSYVEINQLSKVLDLDPQKMSVVYNGIEELLFDNSITADIFRKHFDINSDFILNVRNIEPRKNQLSLVQAMKRFPSVKLVLIGYSGDDAYLRQFIEEGRDQGICNGPLCQGPLLLSAYKACSAFCLPSNLETPGLAALEAAAAGAKLVLTSEGTCQECFAETATYVHPGNVESIARGIAISLSQQRQCLNTADIYSWRKATQQLQRVCSRLIRS